MQIESAHGADLKGCVKVALAATGMYGRALSKHRGNIKNN